MGGGGGGGGGGGVGFTVSLQPYLILRRAISCTHIVTFLLKGKNGLVSLSLYHNIHIYTYSCVMNLQSRLYGCQGPTSPPKSY